MLEGGGRSLAWHNGGTAGFRSFLGVDPATGANVVVLSNSAVSVDDIGLHLLDPSLPVRHPRPTAAVDAAALERYVGRYELAPNFAIEVTREGDALFAQATGQQRFRVYAASPTRFFLRGDRGGGRLHGERGGSGDGAGAVPGRSGDARPASREPVVSRRAPSGGAKEGFRRGIGVATNEDRPADRPPRRCMRDARPKGRDGAAPTIVGDARRGLARRRPGAVGHSRIVAYRARSPARSAAEGHAQTLPSPFGRSVRESRPGNEAQAP